MDGVIHVQKETGPSQIVHHCVLNRVNDIIA